MIDELFVQNVALIEEASLVPAKGLTVLTGETGAGKTALLSAIKLLIGERGDVTAIREGSDELYVEARFFLSDSGEEGTIVRRRMNTDGRGRVEIDGHMASVGELAEKIGTTVDLCGQHEHQRLLDVHTHVALLDAWIGAQACEALAHYRSCLAVAKQAQSELERVRAISSAATSKIEEAAFVVRKIGEVDPKQGEYEALQEQLPRLEHAEALMEATHLAHGALSDDEGATDRIAEALSALRGVSSFDTKLATLAETLESSLIDLEDTASELRSYTDTLEFDEQALERLQSRFAAFQGLMRTYGPTMEDVFAHAKEAQEVMDALEDGDERIAQAEAACVAAEKNLEAAADALDEVRMHNAPKLAAEITHQMAFLEMGTAEITIEHKRLNRTQWTDAGPSQVEFLYKPGKELRARPLRKIASGGEISRVMLACKVVLGLADGCKTLVFDEVDAGVGGTAAVALAEVLARLAQTHQVIVVTHLAQVAVMGEKHYVVHKSKDALPKTMLGEVSGEARVEEIARMLSGSLSKASCAHAREMLKEATSALNAG